jgi:hypothetical protein
VDELREPAVGVAVVADGLAGVVCAALVEAEVATLAELVVGTADSVVETEVVVEMRIALVEAEVATLAVAVVGTVDFVVDIGIVVEATDSAADVVLELETNGVEDEVSVVVVASVVKVVPCVGATT